MTLAEIERLTAVYASRRAALREAASEVQAALDAARRAGRPRVVRRAAACAAARDELEAALSSAPDLFRRPRTRVLGGIRIGWRRPPARVEIPDEAHTIAALRRRFGSDAAQYLREKVTVARAAVRGLPARVLTALGVAVVEPEDAPFVSAPDDDTDRLVEALLAKPCA